MVMDIMHWWSVGHCTALQWLFSETKCNVIFQCNSLMQNCICLFVWQTKQDATSLFCQIQMVKLLKSWIMHFRYLDVNVRDRDWKRRCGAKSLRVIKVFFAQVSYLSQYLQLQYQLPWQPSMTNCVAIALKKGNVVKCRSHFFIKQQNYLWNWWWKSIWMF